MILVIMIILICCYLWLICPNLERTRKKQLDVFEKYYIAHRGLFNNSEGIPENSIPAFKNAVNNNYGIELDVQITKDNQLIVFHDDDLQRMCGINAKVQGYTYDELLTLQLADTNETIPLFSDVLKIVNEQVPLIVEVKPEGRVIEATRAMSEIMMDYHGPWCMESFNPLSLRWFKKNRADIIRGQLSTNYVEDELEENRLVQFILTNLLVNFLGKPDFIAYNHKHMSNFSFNVCRMLFPIKMVAWTIRSEEELKKAKGKFSIFIFDGFFPKRENKSKLPNN